MGEAGAGSQRPAATGRRPEPERPPAGPRPEDQARRPVPEIGGPKGPEPTRYGDWEKGGRCTDF